ncbi:SH3 domain-containing protein [Hyalangium rubrum]|uniref:SH3 domain-containing protein n=1 Tax=Hyalangium rubrum TaxID=3103134 RepID=A0ABU5H0C9_9BACT|nr:SH3 domain-containing protein [Hyalangium sp. s54d21]MDY7225565.1 SH3 domain-containing protein [Hyalangium sp. s54d21]
MGSNLLKCLAVLSLIAAGCGGAESSVDSVELKGVDETLATSESALTGCLGYKSMLSTTATSLNLRSGPATSYGIIAVMPQGSSVITWDNPSCDSGGWYRVYWGGVVGWASGTYLSVVTQTASVRNEAIARAEGGTKGAPGGVGFSYWWGHGAWKPNQAAGSCSGNCGSCTHTGSYGADCSGFLAKVWQVPSSNTNVATDSHPYGTIHFNVDSSQWSTISRDSLLKADALVYNDGSAGHTFVYESGDGWGNILAHECKGCAYGCVKNSRTATTAYHAIRHF